MTIQQLIDVLSKFDPQLQVFVDGYEDYFDDFEISDEVTITKKHNESWYYGEYEKSETGEIKGIILERKLRS